MHQDWHSDFRPTKIKHSIIQFWTAHQKKALFYRQMAVMLKAGIPINTALSQMKKHSAIENISQTLLSSILKGETLSRAMEKQQKLFSQLEIKTVSAGEISGNLAELMEKLALYFESLQDVKYRLVAGMIYPAILLHAAILIPAIPLLFTKSVFAFFARILPMFILIYGTGFGIFVAFKALSRPEMREIRDTLAFKLPLGFGRLFKNIAVIRFLHAFNCLYSAGVSITETIKLAAESSGNKVFEKELSRALGRVERGSGLTEAFADNVFLPSIVLEMFSTGQASGRLDETLDRAAWHLQNEVNLAVEAILKIVPVVIYLLVALYVASIIISFYARYLGEINTLLE
ncbi:MAG: type II secretion system F family protein [Candidatus Ratteibacteria bacterium]